MSETKRLTKAFQAALSTSDNPADDWVMVGKGFLGEAIDHMDWLEKGLAEWRDAANGASTQARAARATARIALGHMEAMLHTSRTAQQSYEADSAARDWMESIGYDLGDKKPPEPIQAQPVEIEVAVHRLQKGFEVNGQWEVTASHTPTGMSCKAVGTSVHGARQRAMDGLLAALGTIVPNSAGVLG